MNIIEEINSVQMDALSEGKDIPDFAAGDTLRVNVRVVEGTRERVQAFVGVCIGRKNDGLNSSFTVRKISYGEGVERIFPLYSPRLESIEVLRRGKVRRAKLYYLRGRRGKSARITEKQDWTRGKGKGKVAVPSEGEPAPQVTEDQVAEPQVEETAAEETTATKGKQE
jgi:large subunit ribosomal protein L19